jgi:hypothetical protein
VLGPVSDCRLLVRYFESATVDWTDAEKAAASGVGTFANCVSWDRSFASRVNALEACPSAVPEAARYHPETNPGGVRCTSFEQNVNVLGRDPATGFARRPLDNVGLQYGLEALRVGAITMEQFLDLNDRVGGYDAIGNVRRARTEADPLALERTYRSGLVTNGGGGLASTPIIDHRAYTDPTGDIHTRSWSFSLRERLQRANRSAANQVILVYPAGTPAAAAYQGFILDAMDRWLTAIAADPGTGSMRAKVLRNRPADLSDGCWQPDGTRISEPATWRGPGVCNSLYPSHATTRIAAGGPLSEDVLKCRLRPVDPSDYPGTPTPAQAARLEEIFPRGVCDFGAPGVGQQPQAGLWLDFGRGPLEARRERRR